MIYFIQTDSKLVKIGTTTNLAERIKQIQAMNPKKVRVKAVLNGGYNTEATIHNLFAKSRVRGEWFRLTDELKWFIRAIQETPECSNIRTLQIIAEQMRLRKKAKRLGPDHKLSQRIGRYAVQPSGTGKSGNGPKDGIPNSIAPV